MVFPEQEHLVYNLRLSSVGPGSVTGSDVVYDFSGLDLAMKLHYLKGVYFFKSQTAEELAIMHFGMAIVFNIRLFVLILIGPV